MGEAFLSGDFQSEDWWELSSEALEGVRDWWVFLSGIGGFPASWGFVEFCFLVLILVLGSTQDPCVLSFVLLPSTLSSAKFSAASRWSRGSHTLEFFPPIKL